MINKTPTWMISVVSIVFGLLIGTIIMLVFGYNPMNGYASLLSSALGSMQGIGDVIKQFTTILLVAGAFTVASKAGFFNIGLSGQVLAGWLSSVWFALSFNTLPPLVLTALSIIIGVLVGGMVGAIPGILKVSRGASEVITTIMMNYLILLVSNFILQNVMSSDLRSTSDITKQVGPASIKVDWLSNLFGGSNINLGIFISVIVFSIVAWMMNRSIIGFEIESVGLNNDASRYSGINDKSVQVFAMTLSGGMAGLAGVIMGLGDFGNYFTQTNSLSTGFDGIAVALLGQGSYVGVALASVLFSILKIGGLGMQAGSNVPNELVDVVIASIIFFIGTHYIVEKFIKKMDDLDNKSKPTKSKKGAQA